MGKRILDRERRRNSKGPESNIYSAWLRNSKEAGAERKEERAAKGKRSRAYGPWQGFSYR